MPRRNNLEEEARGRQAVYNELQERINALTGNIVVEEVKRMAQTPGARSTDSFRNGVNDARFQLLAHLKKVVLH
ncbi:MAG: hypothetical protein OXB98_15090 [Bryobacterales bacterium]|nr:hypothetical protein [Bryobacterales bacterium]